MADNNDYNWLDDPFKEKKAPDVAESMGSGSKILIGCGLMIALVALVVVAVMFFMALMSTGA